MNRMKMKIGILAVLMLAGQAAFASYPVFDATNNVLAALQKTMDSAFQTIQKANMSTLIAQAKEDFAEQVKIYEECVKQYEECVKIYNQAMEMYNWANDTIGKVKNIKTFLSTGFSSPENVRQLASLVNSTLSQSERATNTNYRQDILKEAEQVIHNDVAGHTASRGIERQKYAQSSRKVADKCDALSQSMLTALQTKDQVLESRVLAGSADLLQLTHASEQGIMFIAEEMARLNSNVSAINRTAARQEEALGEDEMNKAQEDAVYTRLEKEGLERGSAYSRRKNAQKRIDETFQKCRAF